MRRGRSPMSACPPRRTFERASSHPLPAAVNLNSRATEMPPYCGCAGSCHRRKSGLINAIRRRISCLRSADRKSKGEAQSRRTTSHARIVRQVISSSSRRSTDVIPTHRSSLLAQEAGNRGQVGRFTSAELPTSESWPGPGCHMVIRRCYGGSHPSGTINPYNSVPLGSPGGTTTQAYASSGDRPSPGRRIRGSPST